jgi:serine/threonine-protein kinase
VSDITDELRAALADRYEFERMIAEGGMAKVFLARDLKHRRKVAVKVLKAEFSATIGSDRS